MLGAAPSVGRGALDLVGGGRGPPEEALGKDGVGHGWVADNGGERLRTGGGPGRRRWSRVQRPVPAEGAGSGAVRRNLQQLVVIRRVVVLLAQGQVADHVRAQGLEQFPNLALAERPGRVIQKDELRRSQQDPGEGQDLLLPQREDLRPLVLHVQPAGARHGLIQAQLVQDPQDAFGGDPSWDPVRYAAGPSRSVPGGR